MSKSSSLTPYLIQAFYDWCVDNELTPQIVVEVRSGDVETQVPRNYVRDNQIVLNISPLACTQLEIGDVISFVVRFSGQKQEIWVPAKKVKAIFARETGEGIPFEIEPDSNPPESSGAPLFTKV